MFRIITLIAAAVLLLASASNAAAQGDYERPPIDYLNAEVHDSVGEFSRNLESGKAKLDHDERYGYLKSVLVALNIPVSSQTLMFSKTSLQLQRISPRMPRALYYNDDVYVGYCQHGDVLEFAATDTKQGVTFYTLSQNKNGGPKFVRDKGGCLTCHASNRTQNVPGYLVRSVFTDAAGYPKLGSGSFTTDHTSEFKDRWGGWYVTGNHGAMRHMGNTICKGDETTFDREVGANDRVTGSTPFAKEFVARGIQDAAGRSLRDFDLETRLFKYPCSHLILSPAFAGLPDQVRSLVLSRLKEILAGRDGSPKFSHLTHDMRRGILQILQDTVPEFNH